MIWGGWELFQIYSVICFMYSGKRWASQGALGVKKPPASAADVRDEGSIPGSGRSPGGGNGAHSTFLAWEKKNWSQEYGSSESIYSYWRVPRRLCPGSNSQQVAEEPEILSLVICSENVWRAARHNTKPTPMYQLSSDIFPAKKERKGPIWDT